MLQLESEPIEYDWKEICKQENLFCTLEFKSKANGWEHSDTYRRYIDLIISNFN